MSKKDNTHYIIIAVAAILIFLVWRYKTKVNPAKEAPSVEAPQQIRQDTAAPEIIDRSELTRVKSQEQMKRRVTLAAKEKLGMQTMAIPRDRSGQYELPVEVSMKKLWCKGGEYEAIKSLVRDFDKKVFLVTLESSTHSGNLTTPLRVNLSDLSKGFKHKFQLNIKPKTNDNITVAICTDKLKLGKCSEYKPADYPRLDALQSKNPTAPIKEDFTFLLHTLFIKNGDLVSIGALDFSNDYYKRVTAMLKKEDFELEAFDRTWKALKTVRSEPLAMGGGKLSVYLSRNDPKCDMR